MTDISALARTDHHSEHGRWTLWRRPPPPALRLYLREIQGYVEEGGRPLLRKELPSGVVPMILVLGHGFSLHEHGRERLSRRLDRSFIAGLHDAPAIVGSAGRALCMQVDFTPLGARRFLGIEMDALAGEVADLNALTGAFADRLEERLAEARDWPERFRILEAALAERLVRPIRESPLTDAAWQAIDAAAGDIRIGALAADLGVSRKHLAARFRREIGVTPKALARVLRFERAVGALQAGRRSSLADLAIACGYADQAHFSRDFSRFAGETPLQLLARILPDGTGIIAAPR